MQAKKKEKIKHSPTLNTVIMVEDVLKDAGEPISIFELKKKLPKKVMHQTLIQILDYLQFSGRVLIGTKWVLWIYTSDRKLKEAISKGFEL